MPRYYKFESISLQQGVCKPLVPASTPSHVERPVRVLVVREGSTRYDTARDGVLKSVDLRWHAEHAICVVMAARGYPDEPERGSEIRGLDAATHDRKIKIFHAGTRSDGARLLADGGRVLGVTALGEDLAAARDRAYAAVDRIQWPEGFCRRDIGASR